MKRSFPLYGILALAVLGLSHLFLLRKAEPYYTWFYCLAWWSYILAADAAVYRLRGNSLLLVRTREFFVMIPWSLFLWLLFETANLFLENWYYVDLPKLLPVRWLGYALGFSTVLPALFETKDLLEALGLFRSIRIGRTVVSQGGHLVLALLGALLLAASVIVPGLFFPFLWVGFTLLLDPVNHRFGARSLLRDIEQGTLRSLCLLLASGLVCGVLWEAWNYGARAKWIYTVPFFEDGKLFEMPWPGYFGFPVFAVEAYVMYNCLSLFRFGRGWERATFRLSPRARTRKTTAVLAGILIACFSVLIFRTLDERTVDSFYPRVEDAYWIPSPYLERLPRMGIATLDDLLQKGANRKDQEELSLRLLVPKEELTPWIERARLARLKGLGVKNLELLETEGIQTVSELARRHATELHLKLSRAGRPAPSVAKLRIWIREARKQRG
jgi:hypothetical protein